MRGRSFVIAGLLSIGIAVPVAAQPVCYMDWEGQRIDLTHMCGDGSDSVDLAASTPTVSGSVGTISAEGPRLVANAYQFDNPYLGYFANQHLYDTSVVEGPVYNFGTVEARNVVVEIIGSQEGRNDQKKRVTIPRIAPDNSVDISAAFDLDLETWSVSVVSYR